MSGYFLKITPTGDWKTDILKYCELYNIPVNHFIEVISDQKVVPMLRGKALEFTVYDILKKTLPAHVWQVKKENLNAQPNSPDEDVKLIHIETGISIHIEVKSAVRSSFTKGTTKTRIKIPHFKVKSHRSRSNFNNVLNDRYLASDFDLIITNPSNSLILSGEKFEMISDVDSIKFLKEYYGVNNAEEIFKAASENILFADTQNIKEVYNGYEVIPRTPYVLYDSDPNWKRIDTIETTLLEILKDKMSLIDNI